MAILVRFLFVAVVLRALRPWIDEIRDNLVWERPDWAY